MERVIVRPQRGHWVAQPAQVVPQDEQVLHDPPRLPVQDAPHEEQLAEASLGGQLDCGNSGRLKNSSHTFSANSSHGGTEQKP